MSHTLDDGKLNKAALVIAKLLLRTREGKIQWENASASTISESYSAKLEEGIEATITRHDFGHGSEFDFRLDGPPVVKIPGVDSADLLGTKASEIISISLSGKFGNEQRRTPETIVYKDLQELFQLASNPKSVSDDLRLKQVMSYLDRLVS
jgi:hypothetical protein